MKQIAKAMLLGWLLSSMAVFADTGGLKIKVTDESGKPISGAVVEAKTPESLTSRTAMTDENGEAKLVGLDPSHKYEVVVSQDGYQKTKNQNVIVVTGKTFTLAYQLAALSGIQEEVVVVGDRIALVDTTSSMVGQDITLDLTESLPTRRDYQSYLQLAPGTKPSSNGNPSSKSGVNYADAVDSNGNTSGTSTDNVYYIDGLDVTDNYDGTHGADFNSEIIQEQHIITGGIPAEFRGAAGLISRVVTKSGSNEFHGSVNYYFQDDSLVSNSKHLNEASFSRYDAAFTLGGPILKDKLWFFSSYQVKGWDEDISNNQTGEFMRSVSTDQDLGFLKLSWQATDNDKFIFEFFNDPTEVSGSPNIGTINIRDVARKTGGDNFKLEYSHTWDNLILTVDAFKHEGEFSSFAANSSSLNDVAYLNYTPTLEEKDRGGSGSNSTSFRNKEAISASLEYYFDTSFGEHQLKTGFTSSSSERKLDFVYTGDGSQYTSIGTINSGTTLGQLIQPDPNPNDDVDIEWNGTVEYVTADLARIRTAMQNSDSYADYLTLLDEDSSGDISDDELRQLVFDSSAGNPDDQINTYRIHMAQTAPITLEVKGQEFYIQDKWSLNQWTFNLGLRAEKWEHVATDGSTIFTFDWEVAPRLSVVYDIDGDSKVWGFTGRYYDPVRSDMTSFAGTLTGPVREEQIFIEDEWLTYRTRGGSQTQDAFFAPSTKTPYTDEYLIGYSRLIGDEFSAEVTYTNRETRDLLEDYDLGLYTNSTPGSDEGAGELALPLSYFGYDSVPDSNYVIATLAGGKRDYEGLEFTLRKRKSDNWQMLASYSYNQAKGNSNSDGNADYQGDLVELDPRAPGMYGDQPGNIEHIFKVAGSYSFDFGLEIGASYLWNSGLVYSRTNAIGSRHLPVFEGNSYEYAGIDRNWVQTGAVGAETSDSYGTLDLRVKYTKEFGDYTAEFFVDIFNALDDQAVTREQDLSGGDAQSEFGDAIDWVEPRRFYLGARLSF